ncbi:hypothetical protein [Moraxella bovoculi]|uniref:hypothetical protein n=1 Tax=Moraxella bovoculi TaxID=386891 RepID=UPI0009BAFD83|nr:hypothetical protein [Moraxella bovoculi]
MMLVYSENGALVDGVVGHYRNPIYFEKAENGVDTVLLVGDYPNIAAAYQAIGVEVERYEPIDEPAKPVVETTETTDKPATDEQPKAKPKAGRAKKEPV